MIGTARHGFDAASTARQGMPQAHLSRQLPTGGSTYPSGGRRRSGRPCHTQRLHRAANAAPRRCVSATAFLRSRFEKLLTYRSLIVAIVENLVPLIRAVLAAG